MLVRLTFALFVVLAFLGDARILLFVLNRVVFGSHREEKNPWQGLIFVMPPLLLALTLLFWPLSRWIETVLSMRVVEQLTPPRLERALWSIGFAKIGLVWLLIAASTGVYWIVERLHARTMTALPLNGVGTHEPAVIRLRRAHVPFAFLRNLGAHNDLYDLEVTRHEIFIDDLPDPFDGYRIAFLTDTHVAPFMRRGFYREVVAQTAAFDPDLVLLGGDFVSFHRHIPLAAELLLTGLHARDGVYSILGNHDYWSGAAEIREQFSARGVRFIVNTNVTIARGGASIALAGIDEMYRGTPDLDAAFAGIAPLTVTLAVSHHPDIVDLAADHRVDLLVCGHTHGGQIRFPFFGAVVVPSRHEARYASGFHRLRNVLMYVSRGLGAVPPIRILCRPEVATFVLRRGRRA